MGRIYIDALVITAGYETLKAFIRLVNFFLDHGYGKGRNQMGQSGELQAAFDGTHGWFWRNRSNAEVTITLTTSGEYEEIKRVF